MEWLQIVSIIAGILGVSSLFSMIWKDLHDKAKKKNEEHNEEKEQKRRQAIKEIIQEEIKPIKDTMEIIQDNLKKVSDGTLSSLRNDLLKCYYECLAKGYRTCNDSENFNDMFESYSSLGGNSFINQDIVPAFKKIPLKGPEKDDSVR